MLYPDNTASRLRISLDGVWEFALIPMHTEYDAQKPLKNGRPMPVPFSVLNLKTLALADFPQIKKKKKKKKVKWGLQGGSYMCLRRGVTKKVFKIELHL